MLGKLWLSAKLLPLFKILQLSDMKESFYLPTAVSNFKVSFQQVFKNVKSDENLLQ